MWRDLVLVGAGGLLGAVSRHLLATWVQRRFAASSLPWGTLAVNVVGCFVIGLLAGNATARAEQTPTVRFFLLVGVLGGFTTFSSFGLETWTLWQRGQSAAALLNIGSQVVLGLGAVALGAWFTRG